MTSICLACRTLRADEREEACLYAVLWLTREDCERLLCWMNTCQALHGQWSDVYRLLLWDYRVDSYKHLGEAVEEDATLINILDAAGTWARLPTGYHPPEQPQDTDCMTADVAPGDVHWSFYSPTQVRVETVVLPRVMIEEILQELLRTDGQEAAITALETTRTRVIDLRVSSTGSTLPEGE